MRARILNRQRMSRDRGAILPIIASFIFFAVVMAAFVVDIGGLRAEKKEVTLSTDAAALAGVDSINFASAAEGAGQACSSVPAKGGGTVLDVVNGYLSSNGGTTLLNNQCSVNVEDTRVEHGFVTVYGVDDVEYQFGQIVGQSSGETQGVSSAALDSDGGGLRPFGVCQIVESLVENPGDPIYGFPSPLPSSDPDYVSLLDDAAGSATGALDGGGSGAPTVFFPIDKLDSSSPCGDAPGNFGQLDLADNNGTNAPGSCNNVSDDDRLCDNTINGFDGEVQNPGDGSTGNNYNPFNGPFTTLENNQTQFWIPVYSTVTVTPSIGAQFDFSHWMEVLPIAHCFNRNQCGIADSNGDNARWFQWRVLRIVSTSAFPVGPPLTGDAVFPVRICSVTGDDSYC